MIIRHNKIAIFLTSVRLKFQLAELFALLRMLILRFAAIFVPILAGFILNYCLIRLGVSGAYVKHFMLPDTNVTRFWRAGTGDKGVDLKTCISGIKLFKKNKSGEINMFAIFMMQDYVILIFKETCRVKSCYHVQFQA